MYLNRDLQQLANTYFEVKPGHEMYLNNLWSPEGAAHS